MATEDNNERRVELRIKEQATIFLELLTGENESENNNPASVIICNSVDLSENGIQIQIDNAVPIGSILRLVVDFSSNNEPIYLVGEVKWSSEKQGQHFIGFELYDAENSNIADWKKIVAGMLSDK